jgi:hypothetical protein
MNKHLLFCSASFHIDNINNILRENEYLHCIIQLLRVIPDNFEIVICDNSVSSINDLHNSELKKILGKVNTLFLDRNLGKQNIGMGELDELIYVSEHYNFLNYNKIIYFTLRKIVTNPWIFEQVNKMTKGALISNPEFLHLNTSYNLYYSPAAEKLYNDMFFALDKELMIKYVNHSKTMMIHNLKKGVGSEQNLYNFINENNIEFEKLNYFGLIRIDYRANNEIQLK